MNLFSFKNASSAVTLAAIVAVGAFVAIPKTASAHHGVNGQFDLSQTLVKEGVVTRVRFVNPHSYVYFDVTEEGGDVVNWRCELRSGSLLRRKGWTKDMFADGTKIRIFGSPARKEPTTCYTETITFDNGEKLFRYGSVAKDGTLESPQAAVDAAANIEKEESSRFDFSGDWGEPIAYGPPRPYGGSGGPLVRTQAAIDVEMNWTPADNPRFKCEATNIILDYRFDQMANRFTQTEDTLVINYGFMDVVREIHLDGEFPDSIEPSLAGYSVGEFDGDKLLVTTKGFTEGFLSVIGGRSKYSVPHSDQMEVTEVFYVDAAGELVREYTIADPLYLAEAYKHLDKAVRFDDGEYAPFECDDLTVETDRG